VGKYSGSFNSFKISLQKRQLLFLYILYIDGGYKMFNSLPIMSNFNIPMFNSGMMFPFMQYSFPSFPSIFSMPNFIFNPMFAMNSMMSMPQINFGNSAKSNSTPSTNKSDDTTPQGPSSPAKSYKSTKLFDENTKLSITKVKKGSMPYLLIGPEKVDPNEKLPVLVSLHGLYQKGSNPDLLESKEYDPAVIMKKWNLKNFRGYILCPQLSAGKSGWCNKNNEQKLRTLLKEFESTHNVDKDNISLMGFSLGGAGALYFANEMSDVFKKAVTLSPYEPGNLGKKMKIPTKAFAGSRDDTTPRNMTNGKLKSILGADNCKIIAGKGHSQVPGAVLRTDSDKNGCSDVIEWLFA